MFAANRPPETRARQAVYVATFLLMLGQGVVIPLLPTIVAQTHSALDNAVAVGFAVAAFGLARLATNVPAGYLADRVGRRLPLIVGPALTAVSMIGVANASSLELVIAWRVVAGISSALYLTAVLTYLSEISPVARRGSTYAYFYMSFSGGIAAGPAVGGVLAELHSVWLPLVVVAVTSFVSAILAVTALPAWLGGGRVPSPPTGERWRPWSDRRFLAVGFVVLIAFATRNGSQQTVVPVAAVESGVSVGLIGLGFSLAAIMSAASGPVSARLLDRFNRGRVMVLAGTLTALAILGWSLEQWFPVSFLVTMAVYGFLSNIVEASTITTANELAPDEARARAIGYFRLFGDGGYVIGPLVLGTIAGGSSADVAILVNAGALLAAATVAALSLGVGRRTQAGSHTIEVPPNS
jgi:DHA1 family multidrug resistance protein-like MFS transporter